MKTPWKFLVQLTSRRRPAKAQESSIGQDTDPETIESEPEHRSALPSRSTEASGTPDHTEDVPVDQVSEASNKAQVDPDVAQALGLSVVDVEQPQTPARDEIHQSGAETDVLLPKGEAGTKSPGKPRLKRRDRVKQDHAHVLAQSAVVTNEIISAQTVPSGDPFFDEVASLDEEIKKLRSLLAQKLYLQNIQLKKMLERFNVS